MARFKFRQKSVRRNYKNNVWIDRVLIIVEDVDTGKYYIHPFSEYIRVMHANHSLATQRNYARAICEFLNWLKSADVSTIADITVSDLEVFLNEKAMTGIKSKAVNQLKQSITHFLYYLCRQGVLNNIKESDFEETTSRRGLSRKLPLEVQRYPEKQSNKLNYIEREYFYLFLNTAVKTAPDIALGVLLSFTGGLRVGELMNMCECQALFSSVW